MKFVALGIDHRHIYGMAAEMIRVGCEFSGWVTEGEPATLLGFRKRFPSVPRLRSIDEALGSGAELALIAAPPSDRAELALRAMRAGLDVMVDKPGCVTLAELGELRACVEETGRIWSIDFSERFEVRSVTRASELIEQGAIGRVLQTVGLGPHRLNASSRPAWFFERERYGGILTDIASHQVDQFLHFTGSRDAEVVHAAVENYAHPDWPGFQDFGEMALASDRARGYVRVDWFTPDGLPTWGDGRLTILGVDGYVELRKYVDVGRDPGSDHLFLVNGSRCEKIDCSDAGLPYFENLRADIETRGESAMTTSHVFAAMRVAIEAQALAERGTRWA